MPGGTIALPQIRSTAERPGSVDDAGQGEGEGGREGERERERERGRERTREGEGGRGMEREGGRERWREGGRGGGGGGGKRDIDLGSGSDSAANSKRFTINALLPRRISVGLIMYHQPSRQDRINTFQTSNPLRQTPRQLVPGKVNQRSENLRFGLKIRKSTPPQNPQFRKSPPPQNRQFDI